MIDEELKKCPCCGSEAIIMKDSNYNADDVYWIECSECDLRTNEFYSENKQEMINTWNKRVVMND